MNAIISLCHFCEVHGPKILFCTQTLRPQEPGDSEGDENGAVSAAPRERVASLSERLKSVSLAQGCASTTGESTSTTNIASASHASVPKVIPKVLCEGCKSVKTGYVSHDEEAHLSYISTQQPHIPQIFTRMRQACIRSLSCEVCPGQEGPIFYGDDQNGNVLSHTFHIPDIQARGRQRLYSIVVFMMDRIYLLNSWPFLVPQLQTTIEILRKKAQKVMDEEVDKMPQAVNRTSSLEPRNFLKKKGVNNKPARSLEELTGDKDIFKMLHVAFVWTLKACGSRLTETLLEGPPTEDSIIDMENQEETEEGFIKINTKKILEEARPSSTPAEDLQSPTSQSDSYHNTFRKVPLTDTETEAEGAAASEPIPEEEKPPIRILRHVMKMLGNEKFRILTQHVVIGDQIIVCCPDKDLVRSFFNALKVLLPRGCCSIIYHSDFYEESWKCNFLGQKPDTVLPDHLVSAERFLLVEIVPLSEQTFNSLDSDLSDMDEDFKSYEFRIINPVPLSERMPTVLAKMHLALRNENLTEKVAEQFFVCLKEEWMNKVKVLFKFTKAGGGRSEDETLKLLQVVGAREEDKPLLKFWMTGLSVQYRTHILASSKQR
ncbi:folliculin-like [Littorina saxatilis]|uniref:Folliculin n=1 Tax=Littorina saxatilis TaxID=31220 RepID=A0AAN9GKA2_9CAEN